MTNANLIRAKVSHRTVKRRLSVDSNILFDTFIRQLCHVFPAATTPLRLTYLDKDGLNVLISSKEEWKELIQMVTSGALSLLRLTIHDDSPPNDARPTSSGTYNLNPVYAEFGSLPALSQFFTAIGSVMKQALEQPDHGEAFSAFRSISMAATEAALALKVRSQMPDMRPLTTDTRSSQPPVPGYVSDESVGSAPSSSLLASMAERTIEGTEEPRCRRPRRTRRRPRH